MAPKYPCTKYEYVVTQTGPKILPVDEPSVKDEESPADYNAGGYLPVKIGDTFKNGRYRVVRKLGWGHFSTVWLVKDTHTQCHSALKVVKSATRYAETAHDEIKLLTHVSSFSASHPGRQHVISFFDSFCHQGPESSHVCIVFEPLGENLLALIERHKKKGVPRALVKVIAKQILLGLQYLHDECDLVHTDIKPENILISIPDIEAHIQSELSQSQSPTSRRVGIPLPVKSRTGVMIPRTSQRSRRQVQIFDSQPLSSPGRSIGRSAGHLPSSMSRRQLDSGSGSGANSVAGSVMAQMHISRLTGGSTSGSFTHGPVGSLGSSALRVPSGLSSYSTGMEGPVHKGGEKPSIMALKSTKKVLANGKVDSAPIQPGVASSSTSSSSSISSTMGAATADSSSMTSTPPTSLSNSIGNAVAGFMGLAKIATEVNSRLADSDSHYKRRKEHCEVVLATNTTGSERMTPENEPQSTVTLPWKFGLSSSWKEKVSSLSSFRSAGSTDKQSVAHLDKIHLQSSSSASSGTRISTFWKDLGTGAPAPALVVSVVANADGQENVSNLEDRLLTLPSMVSPSNEGNEREISERSSVTATPASRTSAGTPVTDDRASHSINSFTARISRPSLLTRNLPSQPSSSAPKRAFPRPSPPQQVSYLSAHIHHCQSAPTGRCTHSSHQSRRTTKSRTTARVIQPETDPSSTPIAADSVSPVPIQVSTTTPPPTPDPSPISRFPPGYINNVDVDGSINVPPDFIVPAVAVKIADLGNATPSTKHFTEDIQTRQYRAPEAILGRRDWDARADIWSVACLIFELLTAEYLFDPQGQGELFTKDDDHMAQIIELLGDFPLEVKIGGRYSRDIFDHTGFLLKDVIHTTGALRYIKTLKPWPLKSVMMEKYSYTESDSAALSAFLEPMLAIDMRERKRARDMIDHPWLIPTEEDGIVTAW